MQTMLDKFGRLVIPKQVRLHLGLKAGAVLKIEERGQKVLLEPVEEESSLVVKDGLLVFSGNAFGELTGSVRAHRADRMDRLGFGRPR